MRRTHIEGPSDLLFGYAPALCGRRMPEKCSCGHAGGSSTRVVHDYRKCEQYGFFANQRHRATCKTCQARYQALKSVSRRRGK